MRESNWLSDKMRIAVIGPGAIGCLLAASLAKFNEVWLLDHDPVRADLLNRKGLTLEKDNLATNCRINATITPELIGPVDLALLCVKSLKVREALLAAAPLLNRDSLLLTLQNGIDHLSLLPELLDTSWGLGVTSHGATLIGPGHVLHKGQGRTLIGLPPESLRINDKSGNKLALAAKTLTMAGIKTELVPDILNHIWAKLLVNVGINALTAIHNCANGVLLESPETVELMEKAILEGKNVAEKTGITLTEDPVRVAREVCRATATNNSSMLQDVRARRPTEIEAINGALIRKAAGLGLATPINGELVRKIKEIERRYRDLT